MQIESCHPHPSKCSTPGIAASRVDPTYTMIEPHCATFVDYILLLSSKNWWPMNNCRSPRQAAMLPMRESVKHSIKVMMYASFCFFYHITVFREL
jgi:hypothetical protein